MSLDVYLTGPDETVECVCDCCGNKHSKIVPAYLHTQNITHNLSKMAREAGIYNCLWRPDEHGFATAGQIIETLRAGIARMKGDPGYYKPFSAPNGWGTYDQFLPWCEEYLAACEANPNAEIKVSR